MRTMLFLPVLLLLAPGCAMKDDALYPSLKPRPIESSQRAEVVPEAPRDMPSFAIAADDSRRIDELASELTRAEQRFAAALVEARRAAQGTAAPGSEEWGLRTQALGRLVAAQAPTAAVAEQARDLETRLMRDAATAGASLDPGNPASALGKQASEAAERQQGEIDRLAATLTG